MKESTRKKWLIIGTCLFSLGLALQLGQRFLLSPVSNVQESSDIEAVLPLVEEYQGKGKEVLVVFDLDNTLIKGGSRINSLEFFKARIMHLIKEGYSADDAWHTACNESTYIMHYQPMVLVDQASLAVLKTLKERSIKWIGLTAKPTFISMRTFDQLHVLGITWNFSPLQKQTFLYLKNSEDPAMYQDGIVFCGRYNTKQEVLRAFFKVSGYKPDVVIFVDDEPRYMDGMQKGMKKARIDFEGIRYSACDAAAKVFDYEKAMQEFAAFKSWMANNQFQSWEFVRV